MCLNISTPLPFFAAITSSTVSSMVSSSKPGSTTITGATSNGVLAVTGIPPLDGIA